MVASSEKAVIDSQEMTKIVPFLKWAGGKRWLTLKYPELFEGAKSGRYFEPFLGGGAVFSFIKPNQAILSDLNPEVINLYQMVKDLGYIFDDRLQRFQVLHSSDFYYSVRNEEQRSPLDRALRLLYLNRTCFNGIYRVNRKGEFNVPKGTKDQVLLPSDNFPGWQKILDRAEILCSDFEPTIACAKKGDFIFVDPPYTVSHNNNGFLKYNEVLFSWEDQKRLASCLRKAGARGAKIVATNANYQAVKELYSSDFAIRIIDRPSTIAASSKKRGRYQEIVVTN